MRRIGLPNIILSWFAVSVWHVFDEFLKSTSAAKSSGSSVSKKSNFLIRFFDSSSESESILLLLWVFCKIIINNSDNK